MEAIPVELPYERPTWKKVSSVLKEIASSQFKTYQDCLNKIVEAYSLCTSENFELKDTPFISLKDFFENYVSSEECNEYLEKSFPKIAEMALTAENYKPKEHLFYSLQNKSSTVKLDRNYVAGLVAMGFLCFYEENTELELTSLNFTYFFFPEYFKSKSPSFQVAKLKCILHYFARLCDAGKLSGEMTFHRIHLESADLLERENLGQSKKSLCSLRVDHHNTIEDSGSETLQVDFANEYIGGGVLGGGCVQEEIRFCVCPELLASMLFMTRMEPREAIVMQGFEQFSHYTGYAGSFTYAGDCQDEARREADGSPATSIVAIDAVPYPLDARQQYTWTHIHRDIQKAYTGFLQPYVPPTNHKREVATGNWGCGAFGGDPQLKSLLQWIAASEADCPALLYYTFNNIDVRRLQQVVERVTQAHWKVRDLFLCIMDYSGEKFMKQRLFDFITKALSSSEAELSASVQGLHTTDKQGTSSDSKQEESGETGETTRSEGGGSGQEQSMEMDT